MKKLIYILLFPFILKAQQLQINGPVRFLALGDSYTIGQSVAASDRWPAQLMDSLALRGLVIDTLGIIATTGWRTDNLINAITNQNLQKQHYSLVSLLIGVNNQYQGSPFTQYKNEFPQLLDSAIRYAGGDTSHVFVVSIPDYAIRLTDKVQETKPLLVRRLINTMWRINILRIVCIFVISTSRRFQEWVLLNLHLWQVMDCIPQEFNIPNG